QEIGTEFFHVSPAPKIRPEDIWESQEVKALSQGTNQNFLLIQAIAHFVNEGKFGTQAGGQFSSQGQLAASQRVQVLRFLSASRLAEGNQSEGRAVTQRASRRKCPKAGWFEHGARKQWMGKIHGR